MDLGSGFGRAVQATVFRSGALGTRPAVPASWDALEERARRAVSAEAWAYLAGAAGRGSTAAADRTAYARRRLVPRVLRDVTRRDLSVELWGARIPSPVIAAPIGVLELAHPSADIAAARAAASLGVPFTISSQASAPMEAIRSAVPDAELWFQPYVSASDALVESLIRRAEAIGVRALVVTLDTQTLGWRPRDLDLAHLPFIHGKGIANYTSDPVFRGLVAERVRSDPPARPARITADAVRTLVGLSRRWPGPTLGNLRSPEPRAGVETFLDVFNRPDLGTDDLARLRALTSLPLLVKGVLHPDDAARVVDAGVDGIVVSTHAGRQVDGSIAALDALPAVLAAVDGRVPVLVDSGIRGGSDIAIALALGASAVLVGRSWVHGLAIAGETGAAEVLRNLIAELDLALALTGSRTPRELAERRLADD